jgi:hypothetical protein
VTVDQLPAHLRRPVAADRRGDVARLDAASLAAGAWAALWAGHFGGLVFFMGASVASYLSDGRPHDRYVIAEYHHSGAPNLATYVVGDNLSGAIVMLLALPVFAVAFGAAGRVACHTARAVAALGRRRLCYAPRQGHYAGQPLVVTRSVTHPAQSIFQKRIRPVSRAADNQEFTAHLDGPAAAGLLGAMEIRAPACIWPEPPGRALG